MRVIKASTAMRFEPNDISNLETECLFGENVQILGENFNWLYCRLLTDNYCGWIRREDLGYIVNLSHRVITTRTFIYKKKDEKSCCITYLPLGSQLSIKETDSIWAMINLPKNYEEKNGYVPVNHLVPLEHVCKDWVGICESLVGTPYKWGGRDSIGLDCSALLQLSYQTYGQNIPRNTNDQVNISKNIIKDINNLKRGFVVFWKGHVGIMVDSNNCIHANAYHMKITVEPLTEIVSRMPLQNKIIKIMDFN